MFFLRTRKGSILVFALWTLVLLTVFAVQIGMRIRQRAVVFSRMELRNQLRLLGEAGVKKAISVLKQDLNRQPTLTSYGKWYRYNNPDKFAAIQFGEEAVAKVYQFEEAGRKRYGMTDEESKININFADRNVMARIIGMAVHLEQREAERLADAIIEWREFGQTELKGFYSDEYYSTQTHPYEPKHAPFETLDELLLVRGFDEKILEQLRPWLTIYGDGLVNINTAPREVIIALGLDEVLADKLLLVRRGFDEQENTVDDYIFAKTFDVAAELKNFVKLELAEVKQVDFLNQRGMIKTESFFFGINVEAGTAKNKLRLTTAAVFNVLENRIIYWSEKFVNSFED